MILSTTPGRFSADDCASTPNWDGSEIPAAYLRAISSPHFLQQDRKL